MAGVAASPEERRVRHFRVKGMIGLLDVVTSLLYVKVALLVKGACQRQRQKRPNAGQAPLRGVLDAPRALGLFA